MLPNTKLNIVRGKPEIGFVYILMEVRLTIEPALGTHRGPYIGPGPLV